MSRQRQYREALRCAFEVPDVTIEFATGGVCAPLSPIYQLHTIPLEHLRRNETTIRKIAAAYDLPPELILGIPQELPDGP